jgi:hypothetical protein
MATINVKFDLINELSIIFFWVGMWGVLDVTLHNTMLVKYRLYCYALLILTAIYIKLG